MYSCNTHLRNRQTSSEMVRFAKSHNIKFEKIPDSKWIRTCKRGGWFEPGLSFTLYMEDNINFEYNKERCEDAYNQIIKKIEKVYYYYKDTNDLELSRFIL